LVLAQGTSFRLQAEYNRIERFFGPKGQQFT
jgi:hypothetical protein